jgi:hypothetical protein
MKNHILIISDNQREVDYSILKSFYSEISKLEKIKGTKQEISQLFDKTKLTILDVTSLKAIQSLMHKINSYAPSMSYLIVQSFDSNMRHEFFEFNKGFGQVGILNYRKEYPELLIEHVNQLIHPEYPVGASDIAIILPVYNEESRFQNVINFYNKLETLCNDSFVNAVVYFVNDGSKDRTQELVEQIITKQRLEATSVSNISFANTHQLVMNTRKAGTYIEGIKTIRADVLLFVDADDSFCIEDMAKMINIVREGYYELVVGTKDLTAENRPPIRRLMSFVKRQLTKSLLPIGIYDSQTGLKAINGTAAKYILPHLNMTTGLAIDLEILHIAKKYHFRTLQVPVQCIDQEGSHISIVKDSLQFIRNIFVIKHRNRNVSINRDI